jgi:hypothetical protein
LYVCFDGFTSDIEDGYPELHVVVIAKRGVDL